MPTSAFTYDGVFTVHACEGPNIHIEESDAKRTMIEHESEREEESDDDDDEGNILDENSRILDETSISTRDINSSFINVKKNMDVSASLNFVNGI